ncbi:hypothetical protein BBR01nite_08620 [Brevibacillus brevis]|nr:hypothetical protein BBR01nite_08620 [Brevibacillus brevis]
MNNHGYSDVAFVLGKIRRFTLHQNPQKCRNRQEDMYLSIMRKPDIDKSYYRRNEITERENDRAPGRDGYWNIA